MSSRWILLAAFVAGTSWTVGCGGGAATETATTGGDGDAVQTAGGELVPAGQAQIGDRTRCPVSGEEFVVTADSPHAEHEGRTYYFCCPNCIERFQANPAQFTQPAGGPAAEPPAADGDAAAAPAT